MTIEDLYPPESDLERALRNPKSNLAPVYEFGGSRGAAARLVPVFEQIAEIKRDRAQQ